MTAYLLRMRYGQKHCSKIFSLLLRHLQLRSLAGPLILGRAPISGIHMTVLGLPLALAAWSRQVCCFWPAVPIARASNGKDRCEDVPDSSRLPMLRLALLSTAEQTKVEVNGGVIEDRRRFSMKLIQD
ncbi:MULTISPECIES: hypothetical protein [unclassified Rhizobium]|uniref:hypothetical protein n=1 Tax=unclassified Rhizobium TaxID=2613769 RepID=UPI001AD9D798|nr:MULTISPECIES: hypothetical protein [unclassified Rhizobium]MBO9136308.1 hypothetical protein [Rhizobium sp. B209b/85]MBO9186519.1 hypothetical protein [Rhizobium sp. E27B/91]QXZ86093.1 hypothetical protein J5287_23605 [Rhizobium sp. K1/93]QXZ92451.1 hypothetical protein J5280_25585 [Rhizobium sp. K15/93]QXZ98707.1 hypothetical protein J5289_19365 [Rhizobium sp. B230/85]